MTYYRETREDREMGSELNELPWSTKELTQMERECAELDAMYAADDRAEKLRLEELGKPEAALAFIQECHGGDECDGEYPSPVEVLEVLAVTETRVEARVRLADGSIRNVNAWMKHYPGDRECPPDVDVGYEHF